MYIIILSMWSRIMLNIRHITSSEGLKMPSRNSWVVRFAFFLLRLKFIEIRWVILVCWLGFSLIRGKNAAWGWQINTNLKNERLRIEIESLINKNLENQKIENSTFSEIKFFKFLISAEETIVLCCFMLKKLHFYLI